MFKLFGDRTIARAVKSILAQKIEEAQEEFNEVVKGLNSRLKEEISAAKAKHASDKETHAREISSKILGY